ncbi:protein heat-stress-associated 32, partial [Tanacetum coccineum]
KGYSSYTEYIEECKQLGFDTVELNMRLLQLREDTLLRYIRLIKSKGLKARLQFDVKFNHVDIPPTHEREHVVYVFPINPTSGQFSKIDIAVYSRFVIDESKLFELFNMGGAELRLVAIIETVMSSYLDYTVSILRFEDI